MGAASSRSFAVGKASLLGNASTVSEMVGDSEGVKEPRGRRGAASLKRLVLLGGIATLLIAVAYLLSQDRTPPSVEVRGVEQLGGELLITADIEDESGVAEAYALVRYPSGRILKVALRGRGGTYNLSHPILLSEEGDYWIDLVARDAGGNLAKVSITHSFYDDPTISGVSYVYEPLLLNFNVTVSDLGGVSEVILQILNKNYTLHPIEVDDYGRGVYGGSIEIQALSENIDYKILVFDKFNRSSSLTGNLTLTPKQVFMTWVKSRGYDVKLGLKFYDTFPILRYLFEGGKLDVVEDVLKIAHVNRSDIPKNIAYQVLEQIDRNWRVRSEGIPAKAEYLLRNYGELTEITFDLLENLEMYDLRRKSTIYLVPNYTMSLIELHLPKHDKNSILNLIKAAELNPDIVDFSPIIIKVDFKLVDKNVPIYEGSWKYLDKIPNDIIVNPSEDEMEKMFKAKKDFSVVYVIKSNNIPRDVWMICEHLRRTPYVLKHPEMFEALSIKVQQNAWDIFDNPEVKSSHFFRPSDEYIWKEILIPHWEY